MVEVRSGAGRGSADLVEGRFGAGAGRDTQLDDFGTGERQVRTLEHGEPGRGERGRLIIGEADRHDLVGRAHRRRLWRNGPAHGCAPLHARLETPLQPAQQIAAPQPSRADRTIAAPRAAR